MYNNIISPCKYETIKYFFREGKNIINNIYKLFKTVFYKYDQKEGDTLLSLK